MAKESMKSSAEQKSDAPKWMTSRNGDLLRCCLAEFLGVAILVLFTSGTCISGIGVLPTAISFGLTITCLVVTIGHVSGCHVNPAVTLAMIVRGQMNIIKAIAYIISQLLGGIAGAAILYGVTQKPDQLCATKLFVEPIQGVFVEFFITFLLVFVICNACESNSLTAPLLIGVAITTGHLFAIPLTCSSMNTARSFGPAVIANFWQDHWVYWVGPNLGGILGGLLHKYFFLNKEIKNVKHDSNDNELDDTSAV